MLVKTLRAAGVLMPTHLSRARAAAARNDWSVLRGSFASTTMERFKLGVRIDESAIPDRFYGAGAVYTGAVDGFDCSIKVG